uniref:Septin-type G domain-containing protein n=1 Tax=Acanthochromis polyacanthus TaxID=80966 RepID=A0A3Q1G531_9TELE
MLDYIEIWGIWTPQTHCFAPQTIPEPFLLSCTAHHLERGHNNRRILKLNCEGSPAVYQLRTEKKIFETLTRITVGERNVNKLNKTILLVGETGAGKSTLVNALFNHMVGVKSEDEVWFEIVEEEKGKRKTESQTPDVIVYKFFGFGDETLPYSLTIIDAPGFGDTRGAEHDVIISQRLLDLFRSADGVHEVNAVGLVMKASDNRLSDRQIYVLGSVMSLFGKNMEENIVALLTHSNGMPDPDAVQAIEDFKIKCARNEKNQPVHFLFDNCLNTQRTDETELQFAVEHKDWTLEQ